MKRSSGGPGSDVSAAEAEFALDHLLQYERNEEFDSPPLKRKNRESTLAEELSEVPSHNITTAAVANKDTDSTPTGKSLVEPTVSISHGKSVSVGPRASAIPNGNIMRSPLSTFKLMSQTIAEYGDMISQRRTEIAELQRANQLRLTNSAYPRSEASVNSDTKAQLSEMRSVAITEGVSLASVMADEFCDGTPADVIESQQQDIAARKLDFVEPSQTQPSGGDVTPHSAPDSSTVGLQSSAAWSRLSVRDELLTQLNGEKLRVTELTAKINEMYRMEEEQRTKARELANENDRLEGVVDDLKEQLRASNVLAAELDKQGEVKDHHIQDLEKEIADLLSENNASLNELHQCRIDVANLMDESGDLVAQRDDAVKKLENALSTSLKFKSECSAFETEKNGLVKQRQLLLHQRDELVGKVATLESSVSSFRSELLVFSEKNEKLESALQVKHIELENVTSHLSAAENEIGSLNDELDSLRRKNLENLQNEDLSNGVGGEEATLANEARKHLQMKVAELESALSTSIQENQECRTKADNELEKYHQEYQERLREFQSDKEHLTKKIGDYKSRLKTLQKNQNSSESELSQENELLRAALKDQALKVDTMQEQLALGEQSWVQQAALLKASAQEALDAKEEVATELKSARSEIDVLKARCSSLQSTQPPSSSPQSGKNPSSAQVSSNVENLHERSQQQQVRENKLRAQSLSGKWQVGSAIVVA